MYLLPNNVKDIAGKKLASQKKAWLKGDGGALPFNLSLGEITEKIFVADPKMVLRLHDQWAAYSGPGEVIWNTYQWPRAGTHRLPMALRFNSATEVAQAAGCLIQWRSVEARFTELAMATGVDQKSLVALLSIIEDYSDADWTMFTKCLKFLLRNSVHGQYLRQLQIEGVDTKWIGKHISPITKVLRLITGHEGDFYAITGVRSRDHIVRIKLLCPKLRAKVGGLKDIQIPLHEVDSLACAPKRVVIVENMETGVALEDIPGTLAIIGMGNSVSALQGIGWLQSALIYYWGDIDTWGLAIYGRLRSLFPQAKAVMMDKQTLDEFKHLCVNEPVKTEACVDLAGEQKELYEAMTKGALSGLRLEQERISWGYATNKLREVLT